MRCRTVALALGAILLLLSPAWAQSNEKARSRSHGSDQAFAIAPAAVSSSLLTPRDRLTVYSFFRGEFVAGRCPAGLMRKSNGCRMPDDARRSWVIGQPLPALVVFHPLPAQLLSQLPPMRGLRFVRIDTDIVLMDIEQRRVVETVASVADLQDPNWPILAENDRATLVSYYRNDHANRTCPPDLIATPRGCEMRPLWVLGERLDPLATYELLPERLLAQLGPPPDGYRYIRVGDHILLMVAATRIIRADVLDLSDLGDTGLVRERERR